RRGIVETGDEARFVAADLPGLIEGAHLGKGLGLEFLRHVERTRVLVLLADVSSPAPADDIALVMGELERYSPALVERPRIVALSKADLLPTEEHAAAAGRAGLADAILLGAPSGLGVSTVLERLWRMIGESEGSGHDD